LKSSLENRIDKLEEIRNINFIVRFPDKESIPGEETYYDTPIPDGASHIDVSIQDIKNL